VVRRVGVGKSSLAFDTIYAEGSGGMWSRSPLCAQFLERIEADVDVIDGIAPAVAIKQKNSTRNPRSTVATARRSSIICAAVCARRAHVLPAVRQEVKKIRWTKLSSGCWLWRGTR